MSEVNHPTHYKGGKYEPWDVFSLWRLNYNLGAAAKYVVRAGKKEGSPEREDLEKAINYICHEIAFVNSHPEKNHAIAPIIEIGGIIDDWDVSGKRKGILECIYIANSLDGLIRTLSLMEIVEMLKEEVKDLCDFT